jgi:hypothetical protein
MAAEFTAEAFIVAHLQAILPNLDVVADYILAPPVL